MRPSCVFGETWLGLGLPPNSCLQHVSVWLDVEPLLFPFYCPSFQILAAVVCHEYSPASCLDEYLSKMRCSELITSPTEITALMSSASGFKVMLIDICLLQHLFDDVGHKKHEMSKDDIALKLWWGIWNVPCAQVSLGLDFVCFFDHLMVVSWVCPESESCINTTHVLPPSADLK